MLPDPMRVLYLHGFASSPGSRKAQFFATQLASRGFTLEIPELDRGDFEHLTITSQLSVLDRLLKREPAKLIGSSLGGYLAALYAANHPEINSLLLLAPAFDFHRLWAASIGPERLALWRENGAMPVFHHAAGREMPLSFEFMQDAARFPPFPGFAQPALLFHGAHDPIVPVTHSVLFAAAHPNVTLFRLDSGHELTDVLDEIWRESDAFLVR
jgi:pimeloyl-ACP methyl ester carboxylesterase